MFYNADMDGKHKTSMTELRKDLASYLRIANSGEQVVVTVDGKPFAAVGSTYDKTNNLFIPVQPIESTTGVACTSWVWDSTNYKWKAPID